MLLDTVEIFVETLYKQRDVMITTKGSKARRHGGAVVSSAASQQEGGGHNSRPVAIQCGVSLFSAGSLRVLLLPPTVQTRVCGVNLEL